MHLRRLPQLPFYIILVASTLTVAIAAVSGFNNYSFPVKAAIAGMVLIAGASAVFWKPAVFPIAAYLFAVPFDNLLQTGGGTVTKMLAGASMAIALLVMSIDHRRTLTPPLAVVAWFAFVLWSFVSLTWSIGLPDSFSWLNMVSGLFGLFAIFSMFRIREDEVRVLVGAIIAGGVACASYGLWLFHEGTLVASSGASQLRLTIQYGTNGTAGSINADHFAGELVLPIALLLAVTLRLHGLKKWLGWAALVMLFIGVFIAATRGAVIAIGLVWLYLMIFSRHGRKQLVGMAVAGLLASIALPSVWLRFADPTQGGGNGRYAIWTIGWQAFKNHWIIGSGAGDFRDAYQDTFLKTFQQAGGDIPPLVQDSHNMIVSTSVELGLIGLVLLFAAWFFQFRTVSKITRSSSLFDLRIGAEAGMIGLCFLALTLDLLYFKYLWIGFMIAVLIRNASVGKEQTAKLSAYEPVRAP